MTSTNLFRKFHILLGCLTAALTVQAGTVFTRESVASTLAVPKGYVEQRTTSEVTVAFSERGEPRSLQATLFLGAEVENADSLYLLFSAAVSSDIEEAPCSSIVGNEFPVTGTCQVRLEPEFARVLLIFLQQDTDLNSLDVQTQVVLQNDVFLDQTGEAVEGSIVELVGTPSLVSLTQIEEGAGFIAEFDGEIGTQLRSTFVCNELFTIDVPQLDSTPILLEDNHICSYIISGNQIEVTFLYFVPRLLDDSRLLFLKTLTKPNSIGAVTGSLNFDFVLLEFDSFYNAELASPVVVSQCNPDIAIRIFNQGAPPFNYNIEVVRELEDGELILPQFIDQIDMFLLDARAFLLLGEIEAEVTLDLIVSIFDTATGQQTDTTRVVVDWQPTGGLAPFTIAEGDFVDIRADLDSEFNAQFWGLSFNCAIQPEWIAIEPAFSFLWIMSDQIRDDGRRLQESQTSANYRVPARSLEPGVYELTLIVTPNAIVADNLDMGVLEYVLEIFVFRQDPTVIISGGSFITADISSPILLNAFASCDSNVIENCDTVLGYLGDLQLRDLAELGFDEEAEIEWNCSGCSQDAVLNTIGSPLQLSISDVAPLSTIINISLSIGNFNGFAETSISINVVDASTCDLPEITLFPVDEVINPQDLVIYGESDVNSIFWRTDPGILFTGIDVSRPNIFMPKHLLIPGQTYRFSLSGTRPCNGESESTSTSSIRVRINRPPVGGFISVALAQPNSIPAKYHLNSIGWIDPELDLPINVGFESIELDIAVADEAFSTLDTQFASTMTQRITGFSLLSNITTYIPIPRSGSSLAVITVARDALGGTSSRLSINAVQFQLTNTFLDINGEVTVTLEEVVLAINELASTGQSDLIPLACAAIGSNLDGLSNTVGDVGEIREFCMQAVLLELLRVKIRQPEFISVASQAFEILSRIPDGLNIELIGAGISSIIDLLVQTSLTTKRGERDPTAGSILDNPIRENVLGTISNLVTLFPGDDAGRKLQLSSSSCNTFLETQHVIARISNLTSSVKPAGAPIYNVATENLEYATLRESANLLEQLSLEFLGVPNAVEFGGIENAVRGQLPPGGDDLTIYAAQWVVDIQCNRNLNAAPDEICDADIDYSGPGVGQFSSISNTLSVELLPIGIELHELEIQDVDRAVTLTLDLHDSHQVLYVNETCVGKTPCNIFLGRETVCGEFAANNREWSTDGCQPDFEAPSPAGTVRCICSHLSTFATWERFRADVSEFGEEVDETCEGWFSPRFAQYFFALYLLTSIFLMGWAYYSDKHDEGKLMRGTVAKATLLLLIQKKQKERFLSRLIKARSRESYPASTQQTTYLPIRRRKLSICGFICSFFWSLKYDHTLISMPQFDPNYSKKEKMAVFLTVVLANFAVSAFFYVLRETDEPIELWFVIAVSIVTALCVSLPVKVFLKVLFRTTENKIGSQRDINNNCLKILNRMEYGDGGTLVTDVALVNNYRELVWASALFYSNIAIPVDSLSASEHDLEVRVEESDGRDTTSRSTRRRQGQRLLTARSRVRRATIASRKAWDSIHDLAVAVVETDDENSVFAEDDPKSKGTLGEVDYYTLSWRRAVCISDQKSLVMKIAAGFADTPSRRPRGRKAYLSASFLIIDWLLALSLMGFCLYISIDWIRRRFHDVASNGSYTYLQTPEIEVLEKEEIYQWLISSGLGVALSYGAAEPLALFFRHVLAPILVLKLGKSDALVLDPDDIRQRHTLLSKASSRTESRSHQFLDLVGDIIENVL